MIANFEMILIGAVFASQIGVLSFLTPYRRRRNHAFMYGRYPPAEYPRLGPMSSERLERNLSIFRPVHFAIGVGSIAALVAGLLYAETAAQFATWMFYCLLLQILPMYLNIPWAIKAARARRVMPHPSVRSVELRRWGVSDFVSPVCIGFGLAAPSMALGCAAAAYRRQPSALSLSVLSSLVSTALLLRMVYVLAGDLTLARTDPYMSDTDTFRVRRQRLRMLFRGGAVLGAYFSFMLLYSMQLLRLDFAYVIAGVSVGFQLLGMALVSAQALDLRTRDFSVYRQNDSTQTAS